MTNHPSLEEVVVNNFPTLDEIAQWVAIAAKLADELAKINPDHPAVTEFDRLRNRYDS